jgi:hypothetical protein
MRLRRAVLAITLPFALLLAVACGSSGASDPRCQSLCTVKDRTYGSVCSQDSADTCADTCGAHIDGTTTACGDCLLQDAEFGTSTTTGGNSCGSDKTCGSGVLCSTSVCSFCQGDQAAEDACVAKTYPRKEVACTPKFRDAAKCSAVCVK